jgi:hypothetical protein
MARLDTVRQYFIERFVTAIGKQVAANPGLTQPAELFTNGSFNVTPDAIGFASLPTLQNLEERISSAGDQKARNDLITFLGFVQTASKELTFGLGPVFAAQLLSLATEYAPQVRQDNTATFWPIAVDDYLNYSDSTLQSYYYAASGRTPLTGQVFQVMFQNPSIPGTPGFAQPPYEQRVPFVSTIGIDPSLPPYPTSPLNVGQLNLTAADARFYPGAAKPTLYAEFKAISGSLLVNSNYLAAAATGRFSDLRNNRLHLDPDPSSASGSDSASSFVYRDPSLLVYHLFYPVDDEARKTQTFDATNREGHHLGAGILLQGDLGGDAAPVPSYVFYCPGPDDVRIVPFDHPGLECLQDSRHLVFYAGWGSPFHLNLSAFFGPVGSTPSPFNDILLGGLAAAAIASAFGPVGLVVAGIILVVDVIVFLIGCFIAWLTGNSCEGGQGAQPQPGDSYNPDPSDQEPQYQDPGTYLTPAGAGQNFDLKLIPHGIDQNLYGLISGAGSTFAIQDDPNIEQMLGWAAFPGGIGYQVGRTFPGGDESPGSQWRDYYSLFVAKYAELQTAQSLVSYFGP